MFPARKEAGRILVEAVLIGVLGLAFALAANAVSPRGLSLRRDYFPRPAMARPVSLTNVSEASGRSTAGATNTPTETPLAARLAAHGLRLIEFAEAQRLYQDPLREQELVVFVDARNDAHYHEGHIPGAYQFDRYYPDTYFPTVLPACQQAQTIVVYCTGGDCEDSEFAALALANEGVPVARLSVYGGGMDAWRTNRMPVEVGPRGSGELQSTPP